MSRSVSTAAFVSLFAAAALFSTVPARADSPAPAKANPAGAAIYKAKCASCHAADGSGSTPVGKSLKVRDLRSPAVQKQNDADLTKMIAMGKNKMPAYAKKLTPEQISSLVGAIRFMAGS